MQNTWGCYLPDWIAYLRAAARPQTTLRLRRYQIRRFGADNPDPWSVTHPIMIDWLASQDWSPETRRSFRSALRGFYGWAHGRGLIDHNPALDLPSIRASFHSPRPAPEKVLVDALGRADSRTGLMLLLAARQGLRRGEIARIHTDDVVQDLVGYTLRVHGKGAKERLIPLAGYVAQLILDRGPGWCFPGKIDGHLSARRVGELMGDALGAGWTAHTLRHRFATIAYAGSRDLMAVQGLLGHSRPETTIRYVVLPQDAMRAALRFAS